MAAYKTGAFERSKYYTAFWKTPLTCIPRSKSRASKSRPRWAAHTHIGNVWEYPPGSLRNSRRRRRGEGVKFIGYCVPLASQRPYPIIVYSVANYDPVFVTFGQICNFCDPNLVTFYFFFYELTHFLNGKNIHRVLN